MRVLLLKDMKKNIVWLHKYEFSSLIFVKYWISLPLSVLNIYSNETIWVLELKTSFLLKGLQRINNLDRSVGSNALMMSLCIEFKWVIISPIFCNIEFKNKMCWITAWWWICYETCNTLLRMGWTLYRSYEAVSWILIQFLNICFHKGKTYMLQHTLCVLNDNVISGNSYSCEQLW